MKKLLKGIAFFLAGAIAVIALIALGIFGYIRYQIYSHEQYWKTLASQPIPENALVYVALGDSTAQAIGSPDPMEGYVGQFARKLSEQTNQPVHIVNISKTGAVTKDISKTQLPKIAQYNPDIVTLAIGGNDVLNDSEKKVLFDELATIAGQLPPRSLVADLPTFEHGTQRQTGLDSRAYVKELALKHNLIYVPINEATEPKFWDIDQYAIDFLHPSVKQYTIWADTFWQAYQQSGS